MDNNNAINFSFIYSVNHLTHSYFRLCSEENFFRVAYDTDTESTLLTRRSHLIFFLFHRRSKRKLPCTNVDYSRHKWRRCHGPGSPCDSPKELKILAMVLELFDLKKNSFKLFNVITLITFSRNIFTLRCTRRILVKKL